MPGNPPPGVNPGASLPLWPFPTKGATKSQRVDQGWDLQYSGTTPVPVVAVESGTLQKAGPDPGGFGPSYPVLMLDQRVLGYPAIYYGHTFVDQSLVGKRVSRGQVIGHTGGLHSGGNAYGQSNWLEIGFWNNGPVAAGASGVTHAGQQMKDWLAHGAASDTKSTLSFGGLFGGLTEVGHFFGVLVSNLTDVHMWISLGWLLLGAGLVFWGILLWLKVPQRAAQVAVTAAPAAV